MAPSLTSPTHSILHFLPRFACLPGACFPFSPETFKGTERKASFHNQIWIEVLTQETEGPVSSPRPHPHASPFQRQSPVKAQIWKPAKKYGPWCPRSEESFLLESLCSVENGKESETLRAVKVKLGDLWVPWFLFASRHWVLTLLCVPGLS